MPMHFVAALLLAAPLLVGQPDKSAKTPSLDSLDPRSRAIVTKHARHFFQLPDGSVWDGANCLDYTDLVSSGYNTLELPDKQPPATTKAKAWGLVEDTKVDPPRLWESMKEEKEPPFLYINEGKPHPYTKYYGGHHTEVLQDLGGNHLRVTVRAVTSADNGQRDSFNGVQLFEKVLVIVPDASVVDHGQLRGEFFLLREVKDLPNTTEKQVSYQYVPAKQLQMTPEQLAKAALEGKARVCEWSFDVRRQEVSRGRMQDAVTWRRTVLPVKERTPRSSSPPPAPPGQP